MKNIDRVYAAIYHEEPDVVPCTGGFTNIEAQEKFLGKKLQRIKDERKRMLFMLRYWDSSIVNLADRTLIVSEERIVDSPDHWIIRHETGSLWYWRRNFRIGIHFPLKRPEDLENLEPPKLDDEKIGKIDKLSEDVKYWENKGYFVTASTSGPFEMAMFYLRGLRPLLLDVVRDPAFVKKQIEFIMKPNIEIMKAIVEQGVHGVCVNDDLATTQGLYFSPKTYLEIIYLWHHQFAQTFHKMGVPVNYHSHGNITGIFDKLIDAGMDMINPLDPYDHMDLGELKDKYGDNVVLVGGVTKFIGGMTKEEIKQHVMDRLEKAAYGGGYILGLAGGIPSIILKENLAYYLYITKKLRKYPLAIR